MRFVVLVLLFTALSQSVVLADTQCHFGQSPRRAAVTTSSGAVVELYDTFLKVNGVVVSRCNGLPGSRPAAIAAYGDGYAVGFRDEGVFSSEGDTFVPVELPVRDAVRALASTGGVLWVGLMREGLVRVEGTRARRVRHPRLSGKGVTALGIDEHGELLVGVDPATQLRVEPASGRVTVLESRGPAGCFRPSPDGVVRAVLPGPLCAESVAGGGLPSGHVSSLAAVGDEMLVGTFDAGAYVMRGGEVVRRFATPRLVNAVVTTRGETFVASAEGLFRVASEDGRVVALREVALPRDARHVNDVVRAPDGTLWVATSHGLVGIGRTGTRVLSEGSGLPSRIVYVVAEARDGAIWAGTLRGAARIGSDGVRVYSASNGALGQDWVTALLPSGDGMLAGTYNAGVSELHADGSSRALPGYGASWVNARGLTRDGDAILCMTMGGGLLRNGAVVGARLPDSDVTAALRFEGQLWVGTRSGLAQIAHE